MSVATLARMVRQVRRKVDPNGDSGDSILLARWSEHADQSAFELLLWRHGPMVWDTCRRVLRHEQDAEDAFQATFLTLARKASSIRQAPTLAGWLYRVAHRAALAARSQSTRTDRPGNLDEIALARPEGAELRECLDEEINRLPPLYREAFILCYLQGLTTDEAAVALNCPRGTVGTRVARARHRLRERLERHGLNLPSVLPVATLPPALVETALRTAISPEAVAPTITNLFQEIVTMLWMNRATALSIWIAPVLVLIAGIGGLTLTSGAQKPTLQKKPLVDKPKVKPDEGKGADVQGTVGSIAKDGKSLTVVTQRKTKEEEEKTVELKLTDKTAVTFSAVGLGGAKMTEGYKVSAWLAEKSKDSAARIVFFGDNSSKGSKPSLSGVISEVAKDGKSFTVTIRAKKKNEDAVEKTIKLNDKSAVLFHFVSTGGAKLAKDLHVSVWLAEGSEDTAARVVTGSKADLPSKKDGDIVAHRGVVSAVAKDGKSFTVSEVVKKNDESKKTEIKLAESSKVLFTNVGPGETKIKDGLSVMVWVDAKSKDTATVAVFQTNLTAKQGGLTGKVISVGDDGKSFTLLTPPTKKNEDGKEVKVKLADKAELIFNNVPSGGAKIVKDYSAQVTLAEGSTDSAVTVVFTGLK